MIVGIVLAVVTFWLFAQTTLNVAPTIRADLQISESLGNIRGVNCIPVNSSHRRTTVPEPTLRS